MGATVVSKTWATFDAEPDIVFRFMAQKTEPRGMSVTSVMFDVSSNLQTGLSAYIAQKTEKTGK